MRKCTEKDREMILDYISKEPEVTQFFYGDIMSCGLEGTKVQVFANEINNVVDSLLLYYRKKFVVFYSREENFEINGVISFLKDNKFTGISGKYNLLERLIPFFSDYDLVKTYMCRCNKTSGAFLRPLNKNTEVRALKTENDFVQAADLVNSIKEFKSGSVTTPSSIKDGIKHGDLPIGVFVNDELVSYASATASCDLCAMICAVCTKEGAQYRNKGYASTMMVHLCNQSFNSGKKFLCLFYDNPEAAKIYHKIGFVDVAEYGMINKKQG